MELTIALLIAIAAVAAVLYPLIRGDGAGVPLEAEELDVAEAADTEDVEAAVSRYRAALRADTLCRRCGRANPDGSRFCAECGRRLRAVRARRQRRSPTA
jgi:hypothetical protein